MVRYLSKQYSNKNSVHQCKGKKGIGTEKRRMIPNLKTRAIISQVLQVH